MTDSDLIARRIDDLNEHTRCLVSVYMKWYTFFWVLNSTALAWFLTSGKATSAGPATGVPPSAIVWFFAAMCVLATISSFAVCRAVLDMRAEVAQLNTFLNVTAKIAPGSSVERALLPPTWPRHVTLWGLSVNGASTLILSLLWLSLL